MKFCPNCGAEIKHAVKFCGDCGNKLENPAMENAPPNELNSKRESVLNKPKSGTSKKSIINLTFVLLFVASMVTYFATNKTKEAKIISEQPEVVETISYPAARLDMSSTNIRVEGGEIILALHDVLEKKFVRFVYNTGKREIPLLAYVNQDGKLVTSISMCEPCNSSTFHISGEQLVCNSCGTTWNLNDLDAISGSCGKYPPDPIPSYVKGDEIRISTAEVEKWQRRV